MGADLQWGGGTGVAPLVLSGANGVRPARDSRGRRRARDRRPREGDLRGPHRVRSAARALSGEREGAGRANGSLDGVGGDKRLGLALEPPPLLTTGRHMPHRSETSELVAAFASAAEPREKPAGKPARFRRPASWSIALVLIGGMGLSSADGRAQTIVAPSARTLFNRATLIRSSVEIRHSSLQMEEGSVGVTQYVPAVTVVYGFSPGWMVILAQPYAIVDATHRMGGEAERERASGLADARVFVQYDGLYSRNAPGGMTRLSAVFGVQVPTGADRFSTEAVAYTGGMIFQTVIRLSADRPECRRTAERPCSMPRAP